jgi:hypothetical protein
MASICCEIYFYIYGYSSARAELMGQQVQQFQPKNVDKLLADPAIPAHKCVRASSFTHSTLFCYFGEWLLSQSGVNKTGVT